MKRPFSILCILFACAFANAQAADVHYFGQTDADVVSKTPYGDNPVAGKFARSDDAMIYYETYGQGEPILVLHGGGVGCPYEMGRLIDLLRERYFVIAPATRGHGKSEIGVKEITYSQKADDMIAVLEQTTQKPVVILGFSDGAYTAYKIALERPDLVKKIVAIGAGENIPATRQFPAVQLNELAKLDERFVKEKIALCPEPEKLQDFLDRYFAFFNSELIGKNVFPKLQCPVLMIVGELDRNAPLDTVINAYKMIPDAQLAVIPNAPHQAFATNFEAVWASIVPFIAWNEKNE